VKIKLFFIILFAIFFSTANNSAYGQVSDHRITSSGTAERDILVYPNPVRDNVTLKVSEGNRLKNIAIYSIVGKLVAEYKGLNQNSVNLRLNRLKPGKYLVKYTLSDNSQKATQLIKQ